jgi:amidohydrolase
MDALPGIGHACGHNLIAISGVAVACTIKTAMEKFNIAGKIVLLGTPAEEGGNGKDILLKNGAYEEMDACLMCHPAPGPQSSISLSSSLALNRSEVEYFGHTAHAALSPWEGQNALDAAVLAYNNVSLLRQQVKPSHRIHGIFQGKDWTPNIIPDYAKMSWVVRGPTVAEAKETQERVQKCFEAASLASGCKVKINTFYSGYDLRQNTALGDELSNIVNNRYGFIDYEYGIAGASTDFGHVTYDLPALHPGFSIPTVKDGGNHTRAFAEAARTIEAHEACLNVSKALAGVGIRVLTDEDFVQKVKETFQEDKKRRSSD